MLCVGRPVSAAGCTVDIRRFRLIRQHPVCRVEELTALQDHLHNMLVAVPSGTTTRIPIEEEDVHFGGAAPAPAPAPAGFVFS